MKINDVCQATGLTKKAVAYYQEKGLIAPQAQENGYREFSAGEVERLKTISLLRRLGLTVPEIAQVLESPGDKGVIASVRQRQQDQILLRKTQLELLDQYLGGEEPGQLEKQLEFLEQKMTIRQKLVDAFPGYYGRYIGVHFGNFLQTPIQTPEQREAYQAILSFLDGVEFPPLSPACQELLEQMEAALSEQDMAAQSSKLADQLLDFDAYWEENQDNILQYLQFKQSDAYKNSAMGEWMALFREFGKTSGYYDTFIPLMRTLSPAYDAYSRRMEEANQKLLDKLPPELASALQEG